MKFVRISEEFELSEFELTGVIYYKMYYQIQGKLDLVRVSGEFELSEFELAGFYCIYVHIQVVTRQIYLWMFGPKYITGSVTSM